MNIEQKIKEYFDKKETEKLQRKRKLQLFMWTSIIIFSLIAIPLAIRCGALYLAAMSLATALLSMWHLRRVYKT